MASFTDQPSVPLTPYTPRYDANMYGKALLYKEQQYSEGLQKVQGAYDTVAGLEVYRPQDKEYLQAKVNEISAKSKSLVGSDFSKQSVVNQALGLASAVWKDPVIQKAYGSTQRIKQLQKSQEDIKSKDASKYTPQNEYFDNLHLMRYYNGETDNYDGPTQATQYTDYNKPIQDALKELDPSIQIKMLPNGQLSYIVDKSSTVTPEQIKGVIDGIISTNPQFYKQMQIDGMYTYKDYDRTALKNHITSGYAASIKNYSDLISALEDKKKLSTTDASEQYKLDQQIGQLQLFIKDNENKRQEYDNLINSNVPLEQIKSNFFADQLKSRYVYQKAKDNHEISIQENKPAIEAIRLQMEQQRLNIDYLSKGLNPETGLPLKPGDPLYNSAKTAATFGNSTDIVMDVDPNKSGTGVLNINTIEEQKASAAQSITAQEELLKKAFAQKNPDLQFGTKDFFDKYTQWKANQEFNLQSGQKTDNNYRMWRNSVNENNLAIGALDNLKSFVSAKVDREFPYKAEDIYIDNVKVKNANGHIVDKIHINTGTNPQFIDKIKRFNHDFVSFAGGLNSSSLTSVAPTLSSYSYVIPHAIDVGQSLSKSKNEARDKVLEKYKNDPDYNLLKAFLDKPSTYYQMVEKIINPNEQQIKARNEAINKELNSPDYASVLNPIAKTIGDKEKNDIKQLIAASEGATPEGKNFTEQELEKIVPQTLYRNYEGKLVVKYTDSDGKPKETIIPESPYSKSLLPDDPDKKLKMIIEYSPNKITPTKGNNVLTTSDGQIKYAIGKNPFNESYELQVIQGASPIHIYPKDENGNTVIYTSPGQIQKHLEQFIQVLTKNLGHKPTSEEITQYLLKEN